MYTRSYPEQEKIDVPDGYMGNAFREESETKDDVKEDSVSVGGFLNKLFPVSFGGLLPGNLLKDFKLGWEELLILGVAILLLLSKSGDKECALMLILLIFIG